MLFDHINYWAVLVTGLLSLALGFLWMAVLWAKPYQRQMYGKTAAADAAEQCG